MSYKREDDDHLSYDQIYADWMTSQIDYETFQRDFEEEEFLRQQAEEEEDGVQD